MSMRIDLKGGRSEIIISGIYPAYLLFFKLNFVLYSMKKYKLYILTNPADANDVKYIGITAKTVLERLGNHLSNNKKENTARMKWIKSLDQAPLIYCLKDGMTRQEALEEEKFYIEQFRSFGYSLVNSTGLLTYKSKKRRPVFCFTLQGDFIASYSHMSVAAKSTGNIARAIKKGTSCEGFLWSYSRDKIPELKGSIVSPLGNIVSTYRFIEVHKYTLDGDYIRSFINGREAAKDTFKGSYKHISAVCKGKRRMHAGFRWSFEKVDKLPIVARKRRKDSLKIEMLKDGKVVETFDGVIDIINKYKEFKKQNILWQCYAQKLGNAKGYEGYAWRYKV